MALRDLFKRSAPVGGSVAPAGALSAVVVPSGAPVRGAPSHALDVACQRLGCTYTRKRDSAQNVIVGLHFPEGTSIVGNGPTTDAAIADAVRRADSYAHAVRGA